MSNPIAEARIAIEASIVFAEIVAKNEIVESQSFNHLVIFLRDALEALVKAEEAPERPKHAIFPTQEAVNDYLARIDPSPDAAYRLSRSGDGKCVVQIFKLSGLL